MSYEDMFGSLKQGQCDGKKMGEYNPLRCARELGHGGEHNYYVAGQYPKIPKASKRSAHSAPLKP